MEEPVRKGQRCPVCKKGAIIERSNEQYGRYLACSTFNGSNPKAPGSDATVWNMGGVRIQPKASRMSLLLIALLTVVIFAVAYFVLTQTAVFGG